MIYHFNEGHITAPPNVSDRTVNVLAPTPGVGGMTMAITRDEMEPDEGPQQFLERQLADLKRQVSKYTKGPERPAALGHAEPGQNILGIQFPVSYKQQGKTVHHEQAMFLLPGTRTILSFTFSLPIEFTAEHLKTVAEVLASFVLRAHEAPAVPAA